MPKARNAYEQVLEIGTEVSDRSLRARAFQNLMLVEKHAGRTDQALRYGWESVEVACTERQHLRSLADLGDVFLRCGQIDSAENAFAIVAARSRDVDMRSVALDALAHVAALRGDREEFDRRIVSVGPDELERVSIEIRAEIFLFRGKSYIALSELEEARRWFKTSLSFAETHGVSRIFFEAQDSLDRLERRASGIAVEEVLKRELPEPAPQTMAELREPLSSLRSELVEA